MSTGAAQCEYNDTCVPFEPVWTDLPYSTLKSSLRAGKGTAVDLEAIINNILGSCETDGNWQGRSRARHESALMKSKPTSLGKDGIQPIVGNGDCKPDPG